MPDHAPPLSGVRIVEQGTSLAAGFAGYLLADLGADVLRVEPARTIHTPAEAVLHRSKRAVTRVPAGLLAADVTLHDEGVAGAVVIADAIECVVTAWGGDARAPTLPPDEALVHAWTGAQATQWSWARRPVWLVTPVASYMAGMLAALGTTAALFARRRGAPAQRVEASAVQGALALASGTYVRGAGHLGYLAAGGDPRGLYPTYGLYRTADGWVFVGALTQAFWVKLMMLVGREDLLAHPLLQTSPLAFASTEVRTLVRGALEPVFAARSTAGWVEALRAADIPCGPVQTRAGFLRDAEAETLGLLVEVDDPVCGTLRHPAPLALFGDTPCPAPRPASRPGTDADVDWRAAAGRDPVAVPAAGAAPSSCLEGLRVLDLTSFIAGPFCPMLLGDLGADVVKIEGPEGDVFRLTAFGFVGWNRGKRSLVLDLKRPEGVAVFLDLVRAADVVVDNFRAGVMDRLGIGWERLQGANPRLVHTSITGFGSTGPLAPLPGFDPVFQARSGFCAAQGGADEPVLHVIAYNDYCAGTLGALATVAALCARERTGKGQRVDVSLFRTAFTAQAAHLYSTATGGRDYPGPSAARRIYPCRDGWLCVAATTDVEVAALGRLAGVPLAAHDDAAGAAADAVAGLLAGLPRADALARLAAAAVPAAPCLGFDEVFTDPFIGHAHFATQDHPVLGRLELPAPFIGLSATPIVYRRPAPELGGDTRAVLREIGYGDERIDALIALGVAAAPGS